jgi:hypothetical protein
LEVADLVVGPKLCSQSEFSGQDVAVFGNVGHHSANHEFRSQDPSVFRSVSPLTHIGPSAAFQKAKPKGRETYSLSRHLSNQYIFIVMGIFIVMLIHIDNNMDGANQYI